MDKMNFQPTLIEHLRNIQKDWQLDLLALAKITHVKAELLEEYFASSNGSGNELPTVPAGFDTAVPLVSIYQNLKRMLPDPEKQNEWLANPNEAYEGNRPIEVMAMSPSHLAWVGYTLESSQK